MNFASLNLTLDALRNPGAPGSTQLQQIIKQRSARLDKSAQLRPYWVPLTFDPSGAGGDAHPLQSDAISLPLVVVGAITNFPNALNVRLSTVRTSQYMSKKTLPPLALAGAAPGMKGNAGVLQLQEPLVLDAGDQLSLDVVEVAAGGYVGNALFDMVFLCLSVDAAARPLKFTDARDLRTIQKMQKGELPETVYLRLDVPYTGATAQRHEQLKSDTSDKPLLVTGAVTNMQNSRILLSDAKGEQFSKGAVPIWAMANYLLNDNNLYLPFPKPILLPAGNALEAAVTNGMTTAAGTAFSYDGAGSYIIFEATTP